MRLGGSKVDVGAGCAAGLAVAFGLIQGCGSASFGLVWDWLWGVVPKTDPKSTLNPPNRILHISPLPSLREPQTNPRPIKTSASPTLTPNQPRAATLNCHQIKANRQL